MITGNMVLGATGGGGGTTNYNALINKPISLSQPTFTQADSIGSGVFMGQTCTKVSTKTFPIAELIGGEVTYTEQGASETSTLTCTAANVVDIIGSASAMGYTGTLLTCITPSGNWQNLDFLMFSLDEAFVLPSYNINLESGTYIMTNVDTLALPQSVVVNPNYSGNFLPTVTEANNGKQMEVDGGKWGLVSGAVNGYFNYDNIVGTMYQAILGYREIDKIFPLGSQIRTVHKELGELIFDICGYEDVGGSEDPSGLKLHLLLHNLISGFEFDATEAAVYCGNGLTAGSYYLDYNTGTVLSINGLNSEDRYIWGFTLTQDVPTGGVLVFELDVADWHIGTHITSYASVSDTTAIETVSITDITSDQSGYTNITDASGVQANYPARAIYGSGNFAQSGIYKYLSSTGTGWWTPSTNFDRPPSYVNKIGFLDGLDPKFLAILSNETRTFATNHYYEDGYAIDSSYTLTSKFALPSYTQMGFGNNGYNSDIAEGVAFTAYDYSVQQDLIKHFRTKYLNGQPWLYWMSSCRPDDPSSAREVYTDGISGLINAASPFGGLALVCTISAILA